MKSSLIQGHHGAKHVMCGTAVDFKIDFGADTIIMNKGHI